MHPGGKDQRLRLARNHGRARQQEIFTVDEIPCLAGRDIARLWERFARNGGGVHPRPKGLEQAAIRRDIIALFHQDHIPRH